MSRIYFLSLLLVLGACTAGTDADKDTELSETDATEESDTTAETDAGSDTDGTTDTDSTTDTEVVTGETDTEGLSIPPGTGPCLMFHGIMSANSAWTYEWTQSNRVGSRSMGVAAFDQATQTATLATTFSWSQTDGAASQSGTITEQVACNDTGLYLLGRVSNTTTTIVGSPETDVATTTYSAPVLLRPNALAQDDTWVSHAVGVTSHTNGDADNAFDTTSTLTVADDAVSFSQVQVGDVGSGIQAMEITGGAGGTYWWSQGFGVVKDAITYQLTRFDM